MKRLLHAMLGLGWLGICPFPVDAQFTSLYTFGDGVSTTTNGPGGVYYHGNRFTNGRVWVEVLAGVRVWFSIRQRTGRTSVITVQTW